MTRAEMRDVSTFGMCSVCRSTNLRYGLDAGVVQGPAALAKRLNHSDEPGHRNSSAKTGSMGYCEYGELDVCL